MSTRPTARYSACPPVATTQRVAINFSPNPRPLAASCDLLPPGHTPQCTCHSYSCTRRVSPHRRVRFSLASLAHCGNSATLHMAETRWDVPTCNARIVASPPNKNDVLQVLPLSLLVLPKLAFLSHATSALCPSHHPPGPVLVGAFFEVVTQFGPSRPSFFVVLLSAEFAQAVRGGVFLHMSQRTPPAGQVARRLGGSMAAIPAPSRLQATQNSLRACLPWSVWRARNRRARSRDTSFLTRDLLCFDEMCFRSLC